MRKLAGKKHVNMKVSKEERLDEKKRMKEDEGKGREKESWKEKRRQDRK
jgi:hypothetical protein